MLRWVSPYKALDRFAAVVSPMKSHLISSRFRAFAIASTWIVAMVIYSLDLYTYGLVEINKETWCRDLNNIVFSFLDDDKIRIYVLHITPLIIITILYCVIAVTLRSQDKALRGYGMLRKDQRKRKAIMVSLCVMAAFYICTLPTDLLNIVKEYNFPVFSAFEKPFAFFSVLMFYLPSTIDPIICFSFVGSYRRGLKEIFHLSPDACWRKRSSTRNIATEGEDGTTLQRTE